MGRDFIAYAAEEGGLYQRPRIRAKARLAPIRIHGRNLVDDAVLHAHGGPLRRPSSVGARAARAIAHVVTASGNLWNRCQYQRWLNG
jgi:hypothetical protein